MAGGKQRALTDEEYKTRGLLLDMIYVRLMHAFRPKGSWNDKRAWGPQAVWLDADTMEPIPHAERKRRRLERMDQIIEGVEATIIENVALDFLQETDS